MGVGDELGGKVQINITNGTFENGCAIRLSHAFNEANNPGVPQIPYINGEVSSDAEKQWHIFREKEMRGFLEDNYGAPTIVSNNPEDFYGHNGVVAFNLEGGDGYTGHVDLLYGDACGSDCYFDDNPTDTHMWVFDGPAPSEFVEHDNLSYGAYIEVQSDAFPSWDRYGEITVEAGIPLYTMDADGHFSDEPVGKAFAKNFESENVSVAPVYDPERRLQALFVSEDPESGTGFYIQPQDVTQPLADQIVPNLPPVGSDFDVMDSPSTQPVESTPAAQSTLPQLPPLQLRNGVGAATPAGQ